MYYIKYYFHKHCYPQTIQVCKNLNFAHTYLDNLLARLVKKYPKKEFTKTSSQMIKGNNELYYISDVKHEYMN